MNTNLALKKALWPRFVEKCEKQIESGGKRYALTDRKEATDLICEAVGNEWIIGNIIKYLLEFKNDPMKIEQNFYKIAVWAFILWIREQENLTAEDKGEKV